MAAAFEKTKRVPLSDKMFHIIRFCRFVKEQRQEPRDAAELVTLAQRAYAAGVRYCNLPNREKSRNRAHERFEAKAREMGYLVEWPGLWPVLRRIRGDSSVVIDLPDV